jgi:hypothetical protein
VPFLNLLTPLEEKQVKFNAPYPVLDIITRIDAESAKFVDFSYLQSLPEYVINAIDSVTSGLTR